VTAPVFLLRKTIWHLPNDDGELRAADVDLPTDHTAVERMLVSSEDL
jgi:hypothetical protein